MSRRPSRRTRMRALALLVALALLPATATAEEQSLAYEGVVGVGAALSSLVYGPVKLVYATGGAVISALALIWTFDANTAGAIFEQTVGGDYVITPSQLEGRRDIRFFGP